ncbi:MAG: hypothetical protein JSV85_02975 [Candidatus Bathyarchaeota archaeon]|nr:MAG: hypothetical protein JSV85_02975 [Candidatus Bathyarchaeota archaeon]
MGDLEKLVRQHQELRPSLEVVDVYKMLYQGVFGVQHILHSKARRILEEEMSALETSEFRKEPLIESISIDNLMVRINLRQFKMRGLSSDDLYLAMVRSARERKGTRKAFLRLWNQFESAVKAGKLNFKRSSLEEFRKKVKKESFPPYHHSERYRRLYRPAYRIVKSEVFKKIFDID